MNVFFHKTRNWNFWGGPVVKTLCSPFRGAWVQSLVKELVPTSRSQEFAWHSEYPVYYSEDLAQPKRKAIEEGMYPKELKAGTQISVLR